MHCLKRHWSPCISCHGCHSENRYFLFAILIDAFDIRWLEMSGRWEHLTWDCCTFPGDKCRWQFRTMFVYMRWENLDFLRAKSCMLPGLSTCKKYCTCVLLLTCFPHGREVFLPQQQLHCNIWSPHVRENGLVCRIINLDLCPAVSSAAGPTCWKVSQLWDVSVPNL